jgi:E3 ubiquitin-protein ligase HECTD2
MESLAATTAVSPNRVRVQSRLIEADVLEHAYGIPTLHGLGGSQPSMKKHTKQGRPELRHGRSRSHPFPSLFQSKGKREGGSASSSIDPAEENKLSQAIQRSPRHATGRFSRVPDKDLMTGNCMTCNSTVRWPKELLVFRCTVCLTINDLKVTSANMVRGEVQSSSPSISLGTTGDLISSKGTK